MTKPFVSKRCVALGLALVSGLLVCGAPVSRAQSNDAARDALRAEHRKALQLETQVEQLNQQNQALNQQLADEKAHSDALRQKAEDAGGQSQKLRQQLSDVGGRLQSQQQEASSVVEKWRSQYEALAEQAKKIDGDRRQFATRAVAGERNLASCKDKNGKLYKIGLDLIDRYKTKGFGQVLADKEPFLQMSRVDMENLMQDYEDKLYDEKVDVAPAPDESPASAAAQDPATVHGKPPG